jgi:hypothetical protein
MKNIFILIMIVIYSNCYAQGTIGGYESEVTLKERAETKQQLRKKKLYKKIIVQEQELLKIINKRYLNCTNSKVPLKDVLELISTMTILNYIDLTEDTIKVPSTQCETKKSKICFMSKKIRRQWLKLISNPMYVQHLMDHYKMTEKSALDQIELFKSHLIENEKE